MIILRLLTNIYPRDIVKRALASIIVLCRRVYNSDEGSKNIHTDSVSTYMAVRISQLFRITCAFN